MLTFSIFIIIFSLITGSYKAPIYKKEDDGSHTIGFGSILFIIGLLYLVHYIVKYFNL
jgi:hypothetical protein